MKVKNIAILGSTGSIGTQALEVIDKNRNLFSVEVLVANNSCELLIQQALKFEPNVVVIANTDKYSLVKQALAHTAIKVYGGSDAVAQVVQMGNIDVVLTAMVGFSGLIPTIKAIKAGKTIALANKETLVVAGDIITRLAKQHRVSILPVDSEHSAIFQCLVGEWQQPLEKIILTASGGPFRGKGIDFLHQAIPAQALNHPNWSMGSKVTIDSASLMNKGLEAIEAKWLFGLDPSQIEIVVHPQSIIHSLVQFADGSMKAQMGLPDMRLPIQYALAYPERIFSDFERFDFMKYPNLTFEPADTSTFRNLAIAFEAMNKGGNMPCLMNGANEVAVAAFLNGEVSFVEMSDVIDYTMANGAFIHQPSIDDYVASDAEARRLAYEFIRHKNK